MYLQVGDWQLAQQVHEKLRAGALVHAMRARATAQAACVLARRALQPLLSSLFPHGQRRTSMHSQARAAAMQLSLSAASKTLQSVHLACNPGLAATALHHVT